MNWRSIEHKVPLRVPLWSGLLHRWDRDDWKEKGEEAYSLTEEKLLWRHGGGASSSSKAPFLFEDLLEAIVSRKRL